MPVDLQKLHDAPLAELQHKARTDLIQPDPTKPPTGAPPPPAPQQ